MMSDEIADYLISIGFASSDKTNGNPFFMTEKYRAYYTNFKGIRTIEISENHTNYVLYKMISRKSNLSYIRKLNLQTFEFEDINDDVIINNNSVLNFLVNCGFDVFKKHTRKHKFTKIKKTI